jgi:4-alpha-glucanotransferase
LLVADLHSAAAVAFRAIETPRFCVIVSRFTAEPEKETTQTRSEVKAERQCLLNYLGTDGHDIHWKLIRLAMSSVAQLAIFPLQDVLGLGSEYRMNRLGTLKGNWEWRVPASQLTGRIAEQLRSLTALYDRIPSG